MNKPKIATFSLTSVHATQYVHSLPVYDKFEWVATSIAEKDKKTVDKTIGLDKIPSYVKVYDNDEELINAHPDLDAVILLGSNDLTFRQFMLCADHGIKSILVMKAPTFSMDEYEQMQRAMQEKGITVQVELEMRYDQTVRRMKQLYETGAIGKLLSVQIYNTTVVVVPELLPWVTNPAESYGRKCILREGDLRYRGGCLTDHPHGFDLARYFTDSEFESIYADVSPNFRKGHLIEEGAFVLGKMKNGVNITIDPSYSRHENKLPPIAAAGPGWEGYPKRVEVNVVLQGEKGCILGDCFHSGVYHTGLPYNTFAVQYVGGFDHYFPTLDSLADSIENRTIPRVNLDLHKNTMKAVIAAYESITTGKTIKL